MLFGVGSSTLRTGVTVSSEEETLLFEPLLVVGFDGAGFVVVGWVDE